MARLVVALQTLLATVTFLLFHETNARTLPRVQAKLVASEVFTTLKGERQLQKVQVSTAGGKGPVAEAWFEDYEKRPSGFGQLKATKINRSLPLAGIA